MWKLPSITFHISINLKTNTRAVLKVRAASLALPIAKPRRFGEPPTPPRTSPLHLGGTQAGIGLHEHVLHVILLLVGCFFVEQIGIGRYTVRARGGFGRY